MSSSFTPPQQLALALIPKISGGISMFFSSVIVYLVLRSEQNRRRTYHRMLLGISLVDISKSFWDFLSTWPVPRESGSLWAIGTETTCRIQGFFTVSGVASPVYNASLSIYYLLIIRYGWREQQIKRIEPWLHGVPLVWGFATAVAAYFLDILGSAGVWCWISPEYSMFRFFFFYGPLWLMLIILTVNCFVIFMEFYRIEKDTAKSHCYTHYETDAQNDIYLTEHSDDMSATTEFQLNSVRQAKSRAYERSKKVAVQCFLYAGAFYLIWTCISLTRILEATTGKFYFPLLIVAITLVPIGGFPNFLVYLGPKFIQSMRKWPSMGCFVWVRDSLNMSENCTEDDERPRPPPESYAASERGEQSWQAASTEVVNNGRRHPWSEATTEVVKNVGNERWSQQTTEVPRNGGD